MTFNLFLLVNNMAFENTTKESLMLCFQADVLLTDVKNSICQGIQI